MPDRSAESGRYVTEEHAKANPATTVHEKARDKHPAVENLLRFFEYEHLPPRLQVVSQPFHGLAHRLASDDLGLKGTELTVALRKLLEAKDCAVRAAL